MNTQEARGEEQLGRFLDALGLCEENKTLAQAYLLADERDDSLLAQAQPEDLKNSADHLRSADEAFMKHARDASDREMLNRCIKLFWTIGKSTAIFPLEVGSNFWLCGLLQDCLAVLGKTGAAALLAEQIAQGARFSWGTARYRECLLELAETEPDVLTEAQALGFTQWDNMSVVLAGILMSKRPAGDAIAARQAQIVAGINRASLRDVLPGLTAAARRAPREREPGGR